MHFVWSNKQTNTESRCGCVTYQQCCHGRGFLAKSGTEKKVMASIQAPHDVRLLPYFTVPALMP